MRRRKKRRSGMTPFMAGLIGAVVLVLFAYGAYTKFANPFASPFTVHALFSNANQLRPGAFVRIAGINVGQVNSVSLEPGCKADLNSACQTADVSMTIDNNGLPLHQDATFRIRPRIFLEGNFFIDVNPGTPESPTVGSGHTFPASQGTEPVQFDQLLTSLQTNTRHNLQLLLNEYGQAVKQGGPAYNRSIPYWLPAYKYSAIVAHDFLGYQPHDLSNAIYNQGYVSGALDAHPQNLKSLITDFNTTAGAFARENVALQQAVAELPVTLQTAMPALNALNRAFPPFRTLARTLIPGVKSTGPMIDASLPFISQLRQLVQPSELRGLTSDLSVTVPALAKLAVETIPFMKNGVRPAASCVVNEILPWSHLTLQDPHFNASNGFPPHPVYVEAVDFLPGLAGESRNFDSNGPYIRILGALGNTATQSLSPNLLGGALAPILGVQPTLPPNGTRPPLNETVPCETQPAISDLTAASQDVPQSVSPTGFLASTDHSGSAPRVLGTNGRSATPSATQAAQARAALLQLYSGTPEQQAAKARALAKKDHLSFIGSGW